MLGLELDLGLRFKDRIKVRVRGIARVRAFDAK